jgi:carboxypeptidase D
VKGLLIGNGWISPADQYPAYLQYAYKEGIIDQGSEFSSTLESLQSTCLAQLSGPGGTDRVTIRDCENILNEMLSLTTDSGEQCINMYDVRLRDKSCGMAWPPDLEYMRPYLQRPDVTKALNLNRDKATGWEECAGAVSRNFRADHSLPSIRLLPELIESEVPILLFSGDKDLICNHIGTEELIHNMKWNGGTGFETSPGVWAPRRSWSFEGEPAGYYQQARNLTYVLFYNASHMVPFDFPRRTRDMLDRFIHVDIANIGGSPADSRIDGEKLPQTSVGGHPNSTVAEEHEKEKVKQAEWKAYARSGEAVLVVVIIAVCIWGFFIWRSRRRRHGYRSVYRNGDASTNGSSVLDRFRNKREVNGDLETADFDEAELDRLDLESSRNTEAEHYAIGDDSDDGSQHPDSRSGGR